MPDIVNHERYQYKTYANIPTPEELSEYYAKKYFQGNANYAYEMVPVEIEFKRAQANFLLDVLELVLAKSMARIVEVGSGEGFFLASALGRGMNCRGVDFNTDQLHRDHAACKDVFVASANPIGTVCAMDPSPSCVVLRHVIEHVPDAVAVVRQLSSVLASGSALVIEAPHDFKPLQTHVMAEGLSAKEYWLTYPDHLSYFTPDQLGALLADHGFAVRECYADFPIETMLLSEKFNYQKHADMGKPAHLLRCAVTHYLHQNTPLADLLALYRAYAACKIGRSFTLIAERI
jgi:2-polyprenyl-3-methyl-5-hydroxy-6-metoxy-1,4-benzoquinol methylase